MKHIFTSVAQAHLATVLLVTISVGAYGCADSATVNPAVELASLTITPGTLQPAFKGSITQYSVDLTSNITSVTVSAQPAVSGDSVTINGLTTTSRVITLSPAGTTTPVSIVVSESGSNSRTYTVLINRASLAGNNSLQSLSVSPGTLTPTFDANLLSYTVDVANNVGNVMVTPTLQDPVATVTVDGQPVVSGQAQSVSLNGAGSITLINIVVTAQNGTEKTYLITVSRGISSNANLQNLIISPGTLSPPFSAGTVGYTVNVASNMASVMVTPTLQDASATMTVNGTPTNSGQARTILLNASGAVPSNTFINIIVTAENQVSQKNYVVVVIRAALGDNNLSTLTVTPGSLIPSFAPNTTDYAANVATNVTEVTISATKAIPNAVMLIGSVTVPAGTASGQETFPLNGPGTQTTISISVTAPNGGVPKTYSIVVTRAASSNNNLSALSVTSGALNPIFDENTTSYTVNVTTDITEVTVSATKADPNAVMLIGSVTVPAGTASGQETFPLNGPGTQTLLSIDVTAQSGGAPRTYTVTIIRAASSNNNLSALSVTSGALNPIFDENTTSYTVNVTTDVTEVTVSATKADPNAVMLIGSVTVPAGTASGQETFPLNGPGTQTLLSIDVTAQSGGAPKTYSITVDRALGP
ncbi:MAG: cadherin-like beta sandwich domain-containing protein [Nitrospira sp.]|nr:cadherin-like beta sandwich domain-containing protein [Nitrospira sp.]MDH5497935.1 cadherin-like beta sandwich domain-containing protein [Nitrospira sp.]